MVKISPTQKKLAEEFISCDGKKCLESNVPSQTGIATVLTPEGYRFVSPINGVAKGGQGVNVPGHYSFWRAVIP